MYHKPSFVIPLALEIEGCGGKQDLDGVGMAPVALLAELLFSSRPSGLAAQKPALREAQFR